MLLPPASPPRKLRPSKSPTEAGSLHGRRNCPSASSNTSVFESLFHHDHADDSFAQARARMVEEQLRGRGIRDERVLAAMAKVPREAFVAAEDAANAYGDFPLPIGAGQTVSQPYIVAAMLEKLELHPAGSRAGSRHRHRLRSRTSWGAGCARSGPLNVKQSWRTKRARFCKGLDTGTCTWFMATEVADFRSMLLSTRSWLRRRRPEFPRL